MHSLVGFFTCIYGGFTPYSSQCLWHGAINNCWSKVPCLSLMIQLQGSGFISPGHIQTIPSKYLWRWTAIDHICPELEMFPNIPATCDIIPLTWANLNNPSCKQDVKRAMRRLRTTFSKPAGGGSWGSGSRTWIYTETSHTQRFCRGKENTYTHCSRNGAQARDGIDAE